MPRLVCCIDTLNQKILMSAKLILTESARGTPRLVCSADTSDHRDLVWSADCDGGAPGLVCCTITPHPENLVEY